VLRRFAFGFALFVGCCPFSLPQGLSPATPAQEYIRFNGQVIAIENAAGAAASAPPFGNIDIPGPGNNDQPLSGNALLSGWALSNTSAVSQVAISVDGQAMGNATYGASRPMSAKLIQPLSGARRPMWAGPTPLIRRHSLMAPIR